MILLCTRYNNITSFPTPGPQVFDKYRGGNYMMGEVTRYNSIIEYVPGGDYSMGVII